MDLVVGASNNAVKSLVNKLGSLLAQEYTLIRGVRDDIQYITDELASMQAFLNRLKRAPGDHDEQRLDWMKQVREVLYDIEDCVDDVDHRLSGRRTPRERNIDVSPEEVVPAHHAARAPLHSHRDRQPQAPGHSKSASGGPGTGWKT